MNEIWLIVFGVISGVLGGMGMGGGTLLIPLLLFLDIQQQTIQAINLISFLPMAIGALILHFKNGLVTAKNTGWIIVPAVVSAIIGAFLTKFVSGEVLKFSFGILLLGLGIWQLIISIRAFFKDKKTDKTLNSQKQFVFENTKDFCKLHTPKKLMQKNNLDKNK